MRFVAVRPVEDKELRQLLQEGHTPIDIQWIGTDKNLHRKRNGEKHEILFKSRLVERGGQELRKEPGQTVRRQIWKRLIW